MCKIPSQNQSIFEGIYPVPIKTVIKFKNTHCFIFGVLISVQNGKVSVQKMRDGLLNIIF
jgi:hypothetical protein